MVSLALPGTQLPSCSPQGPGHEQQSPSRLDQPRKWEDRYPRGATVSLCSWARGQGLTRQEMLRLQGALWYGSKLGRKSKQLYRGPESTSCAPRGERCSLLPEKHRKPENRGRSGLLVQPQLPQRELRLVVSTQAAKSTRQGQPCGLQWIAVDMTGRALGLPFTGPTRCWVHHSNSLSLSSLSAKWA